jgi:hypothetical protein
MDALLLTEEQLAWMGRPLSMVAAARHTTQGPCLMRALAWGLDHARSRLHLVMDERFSAPLLEAVQHGSGIAVVFSEPASHRTLQIKGDAASVVAAQPGDAAAATAHVAGFGAGLAALGYEATLVVGLFDLERVAPVRIEFTPRAVFEQTPGPGAGRMLAQALPR